MKRFAVILGCLALWCVGLFSPSSVLAQGVSSAEMHVTVKDPGGRMVTTAKVTVRDESRSFERTIENRPDGEYQFLLLPPGKYTVTVEAPGFAKTVARGVEVTVGQAAELPVQLKIAAQASEVTVSGETELIETQRTSTATTIDQKRIDNLPINGRNYINFTLTNSQVARDTAPSIGIAPTSGLNIGGQRARSNLVNVDGMDAIDNSVNGVRSTVSQEAVQEFQLITNGYAAEYGRASGGVVNIITRTGTNALHGDIFAYFRNRDFQAVNPFSTVPDPAYTRVQAGVTLGGPIRKDKTFFYFSYETTRRQETGFSTIGLDGFGLVPLGAAFGDIMVTQAQHDFILANLANPAMPSYIAALGAASGMAVNGQWPVALGGFHGFFPVCNPTIPGFPLTCPPVPQSFVPLSQTVGNYPVSEGTTLVALRLDHQFNNNNHGMLRVNVSPSTQNGISVQGQNQNFGQNAYSRTSIQTYRDVNVTAQHTWLIGTNKINELWFQYARRGLLFDFNTLTPTGSQVAVNIPGFAFFGREPFSYTRRTEERYEWRDNFSWTRGSHNVKFGADINHLPVAADFTVNFGGLYDFGSLSAAFLNSAFTGFPGVSPVQAYGLGLPQDFIQGVGNPRDSFQNNTVGLFLQDSWRIRPNLTLNYGVRYDVEFTPTFAPTNPSLTQPAQDFLGIVQGIPRDTNNVAPRVGLAWDPWNDNKTVIRASYGIFYDHPLLGLAFISDVADGSQAPQLGLPLTGAPTTDCSLNAANIFLGTLGLGVPGGCPGFGYLPNQQRFDMSTPTSAPVFVDQNFLTNHVPLTLLPFGFPESKSFQYAYSHQASLSVERDLGHNYSLSVTYNFNGGRHVNRPINVNPPDVEALVINWRRALKAGDPTAFKGPNAVQGCGFAGPGFTNPFVPAAVVSFFRPSGVNPSLAPFVPASCMNLVIAPLLDSLFPGLTGGFPTNAPQGIPFADMFAQFGNGSSVYHGLTANLRKRFSTHYELLASYTYSHAIDDSVDLQSPLQPQDARFPSAERATSLFDQRHRFVVSAVYQSGRVSGEGFWSKFFSDWTVAPIVEVSSGRPFNIVTGADTNLDQSSKTDRPLAVPAGTPANPVCGNTAVPSVFSPTGFLQATCFATPLEAAILGGLLPPSAEDLSQPLPPLDGNLKRNAGVRPMTVFTDLRIARRIRLSERLSLNAMADAFNLINRFNVADVNPLFNGPGGAGTPTAAYDPRQFQFALKLTW